MESSRCPNGKRDDTRPVAHHGYASTKEFWIDSNVFFDIIDDTYGVEEDGFVPYKDDEWVEVPQNALQLSEQQLSEPQESVDPLADSKLWY